MSTPQINKLLPEFSLPAVQKNGDSFNETTVSNSSLAGRAFVLFIYPKDATSGCTIERCHFGELYEEFSKLDIEVIGLSRDKLSAHKLPMGVDCRLLIEKTNSTIRRPK